ncbi:MAG: hypothetical protein NZ959_07840 [Armatimonadetes bacterium]|nr:hypothetical protein [Armatimonadota bacterium]MDW8121912.1 hypothetical protein [Armatimonadota bacterium]
MSDTPSVRFKDGTAVVVQDPAMGNVKLATWFAQILPTAGYTVTIANLDHLTDKKWWDTTRPEVVVLPNGRRLPVASATYLVDHLRNRGRLIVFGVPLFEEALYKITQPTTRWKTAREIESERRSRRPQFFLFPNVKEAELAHWRYFASHPDALGSWKLEPVKGSGAENIPPPARTAFRADVLLKGWGVFSRSFTETPFPPHHTLTIFWAKATQSVRYLMVEWREKDGSRWFAHIPVSEQWRLVVLTPEDFQFRPDSPTRGKRGQPGDSLRLSDVEGLVFGLEWVTEPGFHTFWVAGIGTAPDPYHGILKPFTPPVIEGLSPNYKLYPVNDIWADQKHFELGPIGWPRLASTVASTWIKPKNPVPAVCIIPRYWDSLFVDRNRRMVSLTGHPSNIWMWVMISDDSHFPTTWWLVIGLTEETFWMLNKDIFANAFQSLLPQLRSGVFFLSGGPEEFTYPVGTNIRAGAVIVNTTSEDKLVHISFTAETDPQKGLPPAHHQSTGSNITVKKFSRFVLHPIEMTLPSGDYHLSVNLRPARPEHPIGFDYLGASVTVKEPSAPKSDDRITVQDGHFVFKGKRWFAFGVNYWPRSVAGQEPSEYWVHWLDPANYEPTTVTQDLVLLRSIGFNCVSVQYTNPRQSKALRDFLQRCATYDIKVNLFIAGAHPLYFQPDLVRQLIEAADLPNQPALFAYDIAWEPRWGNYEERRRHDSQWREWIGENYGSVTAAESDWSYQLPRDKDGQPTVPKDEHLTQDGPWRVMTAAYRRFLDDFISRQYRRVCQFIRRLDPHHLIGARTGYGGGPFGAEAAIPFDLTAGAKHLDFISPEGWNLAWHGMQSKDEFERATFIPAYARWAGKGKPVLFAEFGLTLRIGPFSLDWYQDHDRLNAQAQLYQAMYELVKKTDCDGALAWWFPGGYRIDEKSDFGIVDPSGRLRPAALVAQKWSPTFLALPLNPPVQAEEIIIDREENARGPMALYLKWGSAAAEIARQKKRLIVKTRASGLTSDHYIDLAIGNTPWQPGKPPKFVNGEINFVRISYDGKNWQEVQRDETVLKPPPNGSTYAYLQIQVGNTGEVTWLPPSQCKDPERGIQLMVEWGSERFLIPITEPVAPFEDLNVTTPPMPLSSIQEGAIPLHLRLTWRRAGFGERFKTRLKFSGS